MLDLAVDYIKDLQKQVKVRVCLLEYVLLIIQQILRQMKTCPQPAVTSKVEIKRRRFAL
jgi:hypothetical protein